MRLHRFFIDEKIGDNEKITVKDSGLVHQWQKVFRYTTGSRVILLDGSGFEYLAVIMNVLGPRVELEIIEKKEGSKGGEKKDSDNETWLLMSIIKNNNFDLVLEKATELGIDVIVPVISDRTIKKSINMDRSKRILKESAEQSGRVSVPKIYDPLKLAGAIDLFNEGGGKLFVCNMDGDKWSEKILKKNKKIGFMIGPEGGWSEKEIQLFNQKEYAHLKIGEHVLRAETAAIVACALTQI